MIIKGTSCAGAARIAKHLSCTETNERNEVYELRGVAADDLYGALREMEAVALGTRAQRTFYHASINTPAHERLTDEQRAHAIDRLESALGLLGQPRVVVIHHKRDCGDRLREHCHIVWSRVDFERMRVVSDSNSYRKHEQVARQLEREFGHARVQGAHVERTGKERPKRTPSHAEMLQAQRTGLSVQTVKAAVTDIWRRTDSGRAFANALRESGYVLARGDRRDFVVIDPKGGVHSLARRVESVKAKDIRARMVDLDAARLPSVTEARSFQRERAGSARTPVRAISESRRTRIPHSGFRPASKHARTWMRRSAILKPRLRGAPSPPRGGFSSPGIRHGTSSPITTPKMQQQASPVHSSHPRHYEVRAPKLYAELKPTPAGGDVPGFSSRSGLGLAFPRAPPPVGASVQLTESPRSATMSSRPTTDTGELRSAAPGASAPDYSDADAVELGQILSAIAEDVYRRCAATCLGIEAQFAAARQFARKSLPKSQIAGALAAISIERRAALAAARRQAASEIFGRSQAAKALYGRRPWRPATPGKAEHPDRGPSQLE